MAGSNLKPVQSSPSSLPIMSSSPAFNSRDWLNISSPAGPDHELEPPYTHNFDHSKASKAIPSLNLFPTTNTAAYSSNPRSLRVIEQISPYRVQISPRSDTLPTAFEFTSSSVPSTPTPNPILAANSYLNLSHSRNQQASSPLSTLSHRGEISITVLAYPSPLKHSTTFTSFSETASLADPITPKSKPTPNPTQTPVVSRHHRTYIPTSPKPELAYDETYPYSKINMRTNPALPLPPLSLIQDQTPTFLYPSFSPPLPLPVPGLLVAGPHMTTNIDYVDPSRQSHAHTDIDRFSFIQSDDWRLSGGSCAILEPSYADEHSYSFGYGEHGHALGFEHGYVSPISRRGSEREGTSYDVDAFKVGSGGRVGRTLYSALKSISPEQNGKGKENTFMQKLISVSGRASGSRPISSSSPVAETEQQDGDEEEQMGRSSTARLAFPGVSALGHRSLSVSSHSQSDSHSDPQDGPHNREDVSSPLTSLSSSPVQPVFRKTIPNSKNSVFPVAPCTPTPAAPRSTRKQHYTFQTPSQANTSALDLVLTPSRTDHPASARTQYGDKIMVDVDIDVEGNEIKHRYRTRSKLAGVRGWVAGPELNLGEVKKVPLMQSSKKRKRRADIEPDEKSDQETTRKKQKKTRLTNQGDNENREESVYIPSPIASRRTTRLSQSTSSTSNSPSHLNTRSQSKSKTDPDLDPLALQFTNAIPNIRTFPSNTPYHPTFPLFYRRFPPCSQVQPASLYSFSSQPQDIIDVDLYNPQSTRGSGTTKIGLCPICVQSVDQGGEGKSVWLSLKFSAYKCYHMQYYHGISSRTRLPFSPPVSFCHSPRPNASESKHEKFTMMEGRCHKCVKWVELEGVKVGDAKVKEIYWWKHAAKCHQGSNLPGERDFLLDNYDA